MITFARLLLSPGETTLLSGLFETDWNYGRAIHFLAPSIIPGEELHLSNPASGPARLEQQGVLTAADVAITAAGTLWLNNGGTIMNRLFLDLGANGPGTEGRYAVTGSSYADKIVNSGRIEGIVDLGGGDDLFDGRLGLIQGAAAGADGDDTLLSGAAAETLLGGEGQDWLDGGDGADSLSGGAGANQVFAGSGNDSITSEDGDDKLNGEAGDDWLQSDRGNDSLSGGDGADTLTGGDGDDTLAGGAGDDLLEAWDDRDQASGGDGNDTISAWGGGDRLFGDAGDDLLEVIGGAFSLSGGAGADTLSVWEDWVANDVLNGGDGADSLNAGAGDDTLLGGAGADTMIGGAGDDVILAGGTSLQDILSLFTL
jgi:Ca2+-binding RTX toxin-like protein